MRKGILSLLANQVIRTAFHNQAVRVLLVLLFILMIYATVTGVLIYRAQTDARVTFQKEVREHWENMPDKHPHRMAHYGYIAFRAKHPLSIFDFGTESYTGNAVFLEAHKQNSVNFSEAGFSTGLLRFGELHLATVLQILLPLVLFFVGFGLIATDRENGTLKLLLSQGASWSEIIAGRSLGLLIIGSCVLIPAFLLLIAGVLLSGAELSADVGVRTLLLLLAYTIYTAVVSVAAVLVSAVSSKAKEALVGLIGIWLLFAIVLPRTIQATGNYLYPSPSRVSFENEVEKDILKLGDSHDPNDPYFKRIKDSVLKANNATSVEQLPYNYSGFQMREGERMSSEVYNRHQGKLLQTYQRQNSVARVFAFLNPFVAVKNFSMSLSGTDFQSYVGFQEQAENYRFRLAQHMNELQIKLISNKQLAPSDKPYSISSEHWKAFPDFQYQSQNSGQVLKNELAALAALLFWSVLLVALIAIFSKKLKAV
ncbi:MAG: ABC transporter permease [Chitinophagaceae bacterium]